MKRKTLFFLLGLLFLVPLSLRAYDFKSGDLYYNITSSKAPYTVAVTYEASSSSENYSGLTKAVIPETVTYNGTIYAVTSIGSSAFDGCASLTSVTIPESVASIGSSAFYSCSALISITLPEGVTSIDNATFRDCSSLTSITIPEAVTNIGYSAFRGCAGLTSITIPKNVTSIGDYAFDGCIGLTSIIWNAKHCADHSSNKNAPFYGINKLLVTSFIFGNEVEHIPADLCSYMSSLISITIPKSVASVGHGAFRDCSGLIVNYTGNIADWCPIQFASGDANPLCNTHKLYINGVDALDEILNIPEGVTCIGNNAFAGCTGLTSVTIPKSVTTIGEGAFRDCSGITSIALAEGISSLGDYAFSGCSGLTSISIPHSITGMGKYAFSGCKSLNSVTIGNSVTSIGNNAFYDCTGLTSVIIGNSVTSIGDDAFYDCTHLQNITIPESVTSIGSRAFSGCSGLTSITIPENVTSIERSAFSGCSGLTSITIPHNVTSIGENAFSGCSGLTSITIPENVTSIERYAFSGCSGLISVIWNATHCADPSSSNYAPFDDPIASQLSSFTFGDNVEHIPAWLCFRTDFTSITMPKNLKSIGTGAFQWSAITSIILPEGVASIGNNAFFGCYNLASVTIPNGVTRIGSEAFYNCSEVPVLVVPNSVTEIGADAFLDVPIMVYGGNAVGSPWGANTVLGESLLSGWLLFEDEAHTILMQCLEDAKGDIVIPETVTTIRDNAFFARQGITSVTIPNSVTHIGDYAFYACTGVFSITIPDDVAEIGEWAFGSVCNIQYNGTATGAPWGAETMGGYIEGDLIYDSEQKTTVIKCNPVLTGKIVLPESVTSIEREAFSDCTGLTSITIPESVTTIGYNAFYDCTRLLSVTIPESVMSIEGYAFYNVNNIVYSGTATGSPWGAKSMNGYVEGLLVYESAAKTKLVGCSTAATGEITIPVTVTNIGEKAFFGCADLTAIIIPESVTVIGESAFWGCSGLSSITLPENLTSIDNATFANCTGLTSIIIPESVTSIGTSAFWGCSGLAVVTIGSNVTQIGSSAFKNCTGLAKTNYTGDAAGWCSILFDDNVANPIWYSENLYINDVRLTRLEVPEGVTSIGDYAFCRCSSLSSISLPASVIYIGIDAFDDTSWYFNRSNGVVYINNVLYGYIGTMPKNTHISVFQGTVSISPRAFANRTGLTTISIPNSVLLIGEDAFSGCSDLTSVVIPESVANIEYGVFSGCSGLTSITIPESVTSIEPYAFYGCSGLTSITIPESVTSIGAYAFSDCYGLTSITLPEKITTINERTFSDCTDLTSVIIPDSVTTIGNYAFSNCSGLTSVIIPDSVTTIGDYVFENCSNLASFTIGNNLTSMGSGVFSNCPALTSITWNAKNYITKWYISPFHSIASQITSFMFGKDVDSIPNSLCENMTNLTSVIIPGNVKKIGVETFWMCRGLTSVTLENGVTNIGGSAFYNCSGLTSITIPNSVTSIGYQAFDGCSDLTSVSIGKNVTRIEDNAFRDCVGLTSITIPESVIDMGCAFYGCTGLTSVTWNAKNCNGWSDRYYAPFFIYGAASPITSFTFGEEVECIPDYLCYGMEKLTSITIPKSVTRIESDAFAGCTGLTSVTWNAKNCSGWSAYYEAPPLLGLPITSFTFGEEVESIPDYLCYGMQTLTSVTIPKSVLRMGASAFDECTGLTKTNYTGNISEWCNIQFGTYANPVSYSENLYINDVLLTDLIIPDGVTSIGKDAFGGCKSLTSIAIPASLSNIGEAAFAYCTGVTSITSEATNPPSCGEFTFYDVPTTIPVYVPCRSLNGYQSAVGWNRFVNIEEPEFYELYLQTADAAMGTVQFDQEFECSSAMAYFSATANEGYHFTQWSDGNTDNPRVLTLTQDSVLIAEFALTQYTLTAVANDAAFGEVTGSTTADYLAEIALSAVANYGYHFVQWSDGNTDNPRMVTLMSDTSLIAEFVPNQYALIIDANDFALGMVSGGTVADYLTELTISATPNIGCHFAQWSDGNTDNPRTVVLTQDTTFTAEFALSYSGKCGDNLYWAYNDGEISITGTGDMYNYTADTQPWILLRENIKTISICNTATSVGENAFRGAKALSALYIGSEVQNIGANAFVDSRRLYNIYCYPSMPPIAETSSFVNYNVYIYAPCESLFDYQMDAVFGSFKYIQCIGADDVDVIKDEVTVVSDINKATFTWPTDDTADSYSLVISKDDVVFCTLVFNANGQLQSIAFKPSRNPQTGSQHRMQTAEMTNGGLRFTVTGLDEDSHHTFSLTVKDAAQNVLHTYEGEFTTLSSMPTAIEQTSTADIDAIQKIISDGQVLILRNGKTYTLTGQEIR